MPSSDIVQNKARNYHPTAPFRPKHDFAGRPVEAAVPQVEVRQMVLK